MSYYDRALEMKDELVANRRYLLENAEVGLTLPKTRAFIEEKLREYGIEPQRCGEGVTGLIGKGGKVLLLRADMDALAMPEESGLPFASKDPKAAHCCGHDMHATMLLGAAKMLKEHESELKGTIKLMFQPGEECLNGSLNMLEHGILENPKVDAALAYHVGPGQLPIGMFMYNDNSTMMFSNNSLKIKVKGKGGHGALPQNCIDPISIGAHIIIALQEIIAREFDPHDACVITVGTFHAGTAMNIIPEEAELTGTLRADTKEAQQKLMKRVKEVAEATAKVYGADTEVEIDAGGPPLICDPSTTKEFVGYMRELKLPETMEYPNISASASEDFAFVAEQVPSTFMYLSSGYMDERGAYSAHNPKVQFNEEVLPRGAAYLAHCAQRWLEEHA